MRMPAAIKREEINHLRDCLNMLVLRENGYNTDEIKQIYKHIDQVICEMEKADDGTALDIFRTEIDYNIRETLRHFSIELDV